MASRSALPFSSALVLGSSGAVGGYLARLLDARGVAVTGVATAGQTAPDTLAALGIAADIARIDAADAPRLVATGAVGAVFAIADAGESHTASIADTIAAAGNAVRICHVVDLSALNRHRATIRQVAALRTEHGHHAGNAILHAHDSRFGPADNLPARIIAAAFRSARGEAVPRLECVETGPIDWGWTPEYVDAVQRIASLDRPNDLAIASGHRLTTAEFAHHAFGFFGLDADAHVRVTPLETPPDPGSTTAAAAIKAATGWSASTFGRDLVRALCEGAADRTPQT